MKQLITPVVLAFVCLFLTQNIYAQDCLGQCPADMRVPCDSNAGGAIVDWIPPSIPDSCAVETCDDEGPHIYGFIYAGKHNGSHYYCSYNNYSWENAKNLCQNNGGHLAVINDDAENSFVANFMMASSAWIGGHDSNTEGTFEWINGDSFGYTNWQSGQPNDYGSGEDCIRMKSSGLWTDKSHYNNYEVIMEVPCEKSDWVQVSGLEPGSVFPEGSTTVAYEYTDADGVLQTCSFEVLVEECVCLECPSNIEAECDSDLGGAEVSWEAPTPADYCAASDCVDGEPIDGFIYMGEHGGSHYYCSYYSNYTWPEANSFCQANGGHLVSINDAAENSFIQGFMMASSAWIGCNDIATEGSFEWVNGDPFGYTNWQYGQPNNYGNEDYSRIKRSTGEWTDRSAHYRYECIMEVPCEEPGEVVQVSGPPSGEFFAENAEEEIVYEYTDADGTVHTCSFYVIVGPCESSSSRLDNSTKPCKGETICSLSATPNPTDGLVQLTYLAEHDLVSSIYVYTGKGEAVMEKTIMGREGLNQADLDLSSLTEGVYYIQVQMRGESQTVKVIKTR